MPKTFSFYKNIKFGCTQLIQLCLNLVQEIKTHILSTYFNVLATTDVEKSLFFGAKAKKLKNCR